MKGLAKFLRISLGLQILSCVYYVYISYTTSQPSAPYMSGIGIMLPMSIFFLLSAINIPLVIFYFYKLIRRRTRSDALIAVLVIILLSLVLSFNRYSEWEQRQYYRLREVSVFFTRSRHYLSHHSSIWKFDGLVV